MACMYVIRGQHTPVSHYSFANTVILRLFVLWGYNDLALVSRSLGYIIDCTHGLNVVKCYIVYCL